MKNKLQYLLEGLFFLIITFLFLGLGGAGIMSKTAAQGCTFIAGFICLIFIKSYVGVLIEEKQRARYERRVVEK